MIYYGIIQLSRVGCHGSTSNITDPDADIAAFLATRGGALCNSLCLAAIWILIVVMPQGTLGSAMVGGVLPLTHSFYAILSVVSDSLALPRSGCSKVYERPAALDVDYGKLSLNWALHVSVVFYTNIMCGARHVGEPVDKICKETSAGSNIFVREWTKATVKVDCNTWQNSITMK